MNRKITKMHRPKYFLEKVLDTDGEFLTKQTDPSGTVIYTNNQGQRHRLGGPAYLNIEGQIEYYLKGNLHRTNGPAVILADGSELYYENGMRHRDLGPAAISPNGTKIYYIYNKIHCLEGPAIIYADGSFGFWVNDISYSQEDYNQAVFEYKLKQLLG
jgi:hypothetical protein